MQRIETSRVQVMRIKTADSHAERLAMQRIETSRVQVMRIKTADSHAERLAMQRIETIALDALLHFSVSR